MAVGIITCHDVYNCGSSLQAYALSKTVSEFCEVEIINYKPKYLFRLIDFMEVDSEKWKRNAVTRWIYRLYMVPIKLRRLNRYITFKKFNKNYLPLSKRKYRSFDRLIKATKYDICICGSDQIWNSNKYFCGEDPAFFLAFTDAVRIAYAASFGGNIISSKGENNIKKFLPCFSAVSVRENSGVKILEKFGLASEQVLDPVYFLSGDEWRKISRKPKNVPQKYVLVYGYDKSPEFLELIDEFDDCEIITVGSKDLRDVGPLEFIWLIDHAETVITTSFHAVSFSIILHTQFITAMTGNPELYERLEDIMALCGLEDRRYGILRQYDDWKDKRIDYDAVDLALTESKRKSKRFLLSALGVNGDKK